MNDKDKTKEQLINELSLLRQRIAELEHSKTSSAGENKFRVLADQSPNMIFINMKGKVVYANKKCEEIMGYSREEFYSPAFDFMDLIVPEHKETIRANLGRHLKGEEIPPYEYAILSKGGSRIETIITTKLIEYEGNNAILGIVTEITNIKEVEKALRESETKYRDLYDNAPDMYHTLDKDGIITDCNETEARMLGYKKEEIIGRPVADFFTEESRRLFEKDFPDLNHEKSLFNIEREFVRKDGTTFPANLNVFSEHDENGKLTRTRTIARDITEIKQIQSELLKAQKLESVGILAGGIAHDFNNILTAIIGNINLAKISLRPEDLTYERLAEAEKACANASKLTHQLLTFSKGGEPVKKTLSLAGLIKDSAGLATIGSNVKCEITLADDLCPIEADEGQIGQAINNLVINAVQSMPKGGTVSISAKNTLMQKESGLPLKDGKYVQITVTDHGIGIPKGQLQKIFDPYFTTKQKGSGLGLAITYSIIKNHNGHINLKSKPGQETAFYIYLPVSQKPLIERKSKEEEIIRGKGRILLMDDEEIVRTIAGEILRHIGYDVEFAINGEEAITAFKNSLDSGTRFDAVILDLTIPGGMGGKEAVKKLMEITPEVKAIASSGYHNDPIMANFREYGFKNVIPKPYKVSQLSELVYSVIADQSP